MNRPYPGMDQSQFIHKHCRYSTIKAGVFRSDNQHYWSIYHDDVIKWKHFPGNWPFVRGIHRSPVNFPHKGQWRGALMFSSIYARINDWVNNREAGDLRRQHGHYDVIAMSWWHHDVETLFTSGYTALVISMLLARMSCWTNSWVTGDLKCHDWISMTGSEL